MVGIKRILTTLIISFFILSFNLAYAGDKSAMEELQRQMMELKQDYEQKFQMLMNQIESLKQQSEKEQAAKDEIKQEVSKLKEIADQKEQERKKEIEELKTALDEQKKKSLMAGFDNNRFYIGSADGNFRLQVTGYMQTDYRFYEGSEDENNKNTFDIRRARLGVTGTLFKNIQFKLQTDFSDEDKQLRDAYLDFNYTPLAVVRVGQFKVPFGYEQVISSTTLDFIERSVAGDFIATKSRDIGVMLLGKLFSNKLEYYAGAFNGTGENETDDNDSLTFIGRLVLSPFVNEEDSVLQGLSIGGSFSGGDRETHTSSTIKLAARNSVSTGVTVNGQRTRAAGEARWLYGPMSLKGEYYYQREERNDIVPHIDLEDLISQGFYVSASYLLTGEKKVEGDIVPKTSFNPITGGWGAFELVTRYEWFDVDKNDSSEAFIEDENTIPNTVNGFTFGFNWYLNRFIRVMANYDYYHFDKQENLSHPSIGDSSNQVLGRVQVKF